MNIEDLEKRSDEFFKYKNTVFSEEDSKESGYIILGKENHFVIEKAIERIWVKLWEDSKKFLERAESGESLEPKEQQELQKLLKQDPYLIVCQATLHTMVDLLKKDGYLEKELGSVEANKIYEDAFPSDINNSVPFNPYSFLANFCVHIDEKHKYNATYNIIKIQKIIPKDIIPFKKEVLGCFSSKYSLESSSKTGEADKKNS